MGGLRPVLAVSHPGHELLVHAWLNRRAPRVVLLTDGSGRAGESRTDTTTALLKRAGIVTGGLYGRHTDAAVYDWILDGHTDEFVRLARELAKEFASERADLVVGDAAEGYNPIHDAFRLTLNAAVELAQRETGTDIASYDFPLFGRPGPSAAPGAVTIELAEPERAAKRREAAGYAELEREVEWSLKQHGKRAFDREWLRTVTQEAGEYPLPELPPIYERYGEHLSKAGVLARVILYEQHMLAIARALVDAERD